MLISRLPSPPYPPPLPTSYLPFPALPVRAPSFLLIERSGITQAEASLKFERRPLPSSVFEFCSLPCITTTLPQPLPPGRNGSVEEEEKPRAFAEGDTLSGRDKKQTLSPRWISLALRFTSSSFVLTICRALKPDCGDDPPPRPVPRD